MRGCFNVFVGLVVIVFSIGVIGALVNQSRGPVTNLANPTAGSSVAVNADDPPESYIEELKRTLRDAQQSSLVSRLGSATDLQISLAFIDVWASVVDKGAGKQLTSEEKTARDSLAKTARAKQVSVLPVLRDKYGPITRDRLWEVDGKAKTVGAGYRTVIFTAGEFAANRNIKSMHEAVWETLMRLRFTRAEYHWVDSDLVEYQYYKLQPPKDSDLVVWTGGSFRVVK